MLPCTTVAALPHRNLRSGQSHTGRHRQRQGPGDVEMKYRWRQTSLVRIINMLSSSSRETFESASWAIFAEYKWSRNSVWRLTVDDSVLDRSWSGSRKQTYVSVLLAWKSVCRFQKLLSLEKLWYWYRKEREVDRSWQSQLYFGSNFVRFVVQYLFFFWGSTVLVFFCWKMFCQFLLFLWYFSISFW